MTLAAGGGPHSSRATPFFHDTHRRHIKTTTRRRPTYPWPNAVQPNWAISQGHSLPSATPLCRSPYLLKACSSLRFRKRAATGSQYVARHHAKLIAIAQPRAKAIRLLTPILPAAYITPPATVVWQRYRGYVIFPRLNIQVDLRCELSARDNVST